MRIVVGFIIGLLVACATFRAMDLGKEQDDAKRAIQNSEELMQKAQTDYREKSALLMSLRKSGGSEFAQIEGSVQHHMQTMKMALATMADRRKNMGEANGQIVSLAYAHPSVRSDEPEFAHAEENHRRWETAYNELKSAVLDYSNASNSIADEVAGHKLFFNFEVADFEKRVQASVKSAQGFLEQMKSELTAAQDSLNSWDEPDTRGRAEELYARLQSTAQDYTTRAQNLTGLAQEMQELSNGAARMTTLDPAWPEAKKLIERRDQIASELTQMQDRFQKDFKALHTPFTTSR